MMAIALIPITALGGSAVDMARVYIVKNRLQQACDSGVLAGRKFMDEDSNTELGETATTQAKAFFANNVAEGWLGITNVRFTPRRTDQNRVAGDASVTVPMSVMRMFAAPDVTLAVSCEARFDIADTDIMFVLDTTGSMACPASDSAATCRNRYFDRREYTRPGSNTADITPGYAGGTGVSLDEWPDSRIAALRTAVMDFYDTMSSAKQPTTRVRYGFVPYASTVNAGAAIRAMSPHYLFGSGGTNDTASYQTRYLVDEQDGSRQSRNLRRRDCEQVRTGRDPGNRLEFDRNGSAVRREILWSNNGRLCQVTTVNIDPVWTYDRHAVNVSDFVSKASVRNPSRVEQANDTWLGCIEETDNSASGWRQFDINNLPPGMNPSLKPSGPQRWVPSWPGVTYQRFRNGRPYLGSITAAGNSGDVQWMYWSGCVKPVQRLKELDRDQVKTYVNDADFAPSGSTEHDIGMLWATRLLARDGVFASDNAKQGNRNAPKQVVVFMTDGEMEPNDRSYGLYGMEAWDRRVANGDSDLTFYHNARFSALCDKAKAMGIDVWTVALGTSITDELQRCASSPDQAMATTSGSGLSEAFKKIAKAVAMLRISR